MLNYNFTYIVKIKLTEKTLFGDNIYSNRQ
jgi:hypothetical protein